MDCIEQVSVLQNTHWTQGYQGAAPMWRFIIAGILSTQKH